MLLLIISTQRSKPRINKRRKFQISKLAKNEFELSITKNKNCTLTVYLRIEKNRTEEEERTEENEIFDKSNSLSICSILLIVLV